MTPERIRQLRTRNKHTPLTMQEVDELLDEIERLRDDGRLPLEGVA